MPEMIENRMLMETFWERNSQDEIVEKFHNPGYKEYGTGVFVSDEDAYEYAMERISNGTERDKADFIEWFYSDNWNREV